MSHLVYDFKMKNHVWNHNYKYTWTQLFKASLAWPKFVKQISAKLTNKLLFFVEKMSESFAVHFFSTKNNSVFVILMFEILTKR